MMKNSRNGWNKCSKGGRIHGPTHPHTEYIACPHATKTEYVAWPHATQRQNPCVNQAKKFVLLSS